MSKDQTTFDVTVIGDGCKLEAYLINFYQKLRLHSKKPTETEDDYNNHYVTEEVTAKHVICKVFNLAGTVLISIRFAKNVFFKHFQIIKP